MYIIHVSNNIHELKYIIQSLFFLQVNCHEVYMNALSDSILAPPLPLPILPENLP